MRFGYTHTYLIAIEKDRSTEKEDKRQDIQCWFIGQKEIITEILK